jgi:hypothetical protein
MSERTGRIVRTGSQTVSLDSILAKVGDHIDLLALPEPGSSCCPTCGLYFPQLFKHVCRDLGGVPLCECGCGRHVKNNQNGVWSRWCAGHQYKRGVK